MCKVVINRVNQFNCRINGYEVYETSTGEVFGMTEKDITKVIKKGQKILGIELDAEGQVELDEKGFYQSNIMEKKTLTKMEPVKGDTPVNILYALIGVKNDKYILVNSRFGKSEVSKEKLLAYLEIGLVQGGCKLEKGELKVAEVFNTSAPVAKTAKKEPEVKQS